MRATTFSVSSLSALLFLSSVTASALGSNSIRGLLARQTLDPSSLPTQCQSPCTTIDTALTDCTTIACLCTTTNGDTLSECVNCIVAADPTAGEVTEGQSVIQAFEAECSVTVPSVTAATGTAATATAVATKTAVTSAPVPSVTFGTSQVITFSEPPSATTTNSNSGSNPLQKSGAGKGSGVVGRLGLVGGMLMGGALLML